MHCKQSYFRVSQGSAVIIIQARWASL